jgi:hypothetical protein
MCLAIREPGLINLGLGRGRAAGLGTTAKKIPTQREISTGPGASLVDTTRQGRDINAITPGNSRNEEVHA